MTRFPFRPSSPESSLSDDSPGGSGVNISPVLMGSDLGIYSLASAFHRAYGVSSTVLAQGPRGPINDSDILKQVHTGPDPDDATRLEHLLRIASTDGRPPAADARRLLIANNDSAVDFLQRHAERLAAYYRLTVPPPAASAAVSDKRELNRILDQCGLDHPRTATVTPNDDLAGTRARAHEAMLASAVRFPAVLKAARSADYETLAFEGKQKAYFVRDEAALDSTMGLLQSAGYRHELLIQEYIPGEDTWGRLVTCYVGRDGEVRMAVTAHLLLGLHTPHMIGNSAVVLTKDDPQIRDIALRLLRHIGYRGFANIDIRVDPRDGRAHVLDVNPRIGRPHGYCLRAGINPAQVLVEDHFGAQAPHAEGGPRRAVQDPEARLFASVPWLFARRYVTDRTVRRECDRSWRRHGAVHPLDYRPDRNAARLAYRIAADANVVKGFLRHYPTAQYFGF